jgi:general secretion pathway protein D
MTLKLDVSQIDGYQTQGGADGVSEPIFGQRKIQEDLRVKEGDVALIGGVTKQQDDLTVTGIPGLSKIPFFGKLFSGKSEDRSTDEMMVVLIPHIIRRPEYTADNLRAVAVGTAQSISLRHAPSQPLDIHVDGEIPARVEYAPVAPGAAAAAPFPAGIATAPPATAPPSALAPPATAPPATAPPATAPPATAPPSASAPQAPAARIRFNPLQMETGVNGVVAVSVVMEGGQDVSSAPMAIHFDPKLLRLDDVTAGGFLASDGQTPVLNKDIRNDTGAATVLLARPPGLHGVSGPGGVLVNLSFQTLGAGSTEVAITSVSVRDSQGQPIAVGSPASLKLSIH